MGKNTVQTVYGIAKPIADRLGLTIWDVTFDKEGAMWYLRVLIERQDGPVDMEDCEKMTGPLSSALDKADPIEQSYMLEVGSPGLGRTLRRPEHFERYLGEKVRVRLIRAESGGKEFIGTLEGYGKDSVMVDGRAVKLADTAFVKAYDD